MITNRSLKIALFSLYYLAVAAVLFFGFIGVPLYNGWFPYVFALLKNNTGVAYGYLIFILIESGVTLIRLLVFRRKYVAHDSISRQSNTALVIPCHRAEATIGTTLTNALKVFDAQSIFVVDNGKSETPLDNTASVCAEMGVNYTWVPRPSKPNAIYVGAKKASNFDFIMQIDDDVNLPEDITFPTDSAFDAMAYTISAGTNVGTRNVLHHCQDLEYKTAGIMKGFEAMVGGSTLFAHGAISLWKRDALVAVLEKHPLFPISDDWFSGYTANALGYRIGVCDRQFIETDAPGTLYLARSQDRTGGYGSGTLFAQRVRWYTMQLAQIPYLLFFVFCVWKPRVSILMQKLVFLWMVLSKVMAYTRHYMFVFYMILNPILSTILLASYIAVGIIKFALLNVIHLSKEERIPWYIALVFPLYQIHDSLLYFGTMLYSVIAYPFIFNADRRPVQEL
jgi:cellulose synthase/poly-beta-1,6-N-acetylglucosamine synthase-like glycosyltransferase